MQNQFLTSILAAQRLEEGEFCIALVVCVIYLLARRNYTLQEKMGSCPEPQAATARPVLSVRILLALG